MLNQKTNERVDFRIDVFDNEAYRNGVFMNLERSMLCPCRNTETSYINADCPYCKGTGYLFHTPQQIFAMVTSLNYQQTLQMSYTEVNATANLTLSEKYQFRLKYFDKLTILDGDGIIQNSLVKFKLSTNSAKQVVLQAQTPFIINTIEIISIQKKDSIQTLNSNDYTYLGNIITLSNVLKNELLKESKESYIATIRYYHYPIYYVLRDEHVIRMQRIMENGSEKLSLLPLQYMIREASYFTPSGEPVSF